jgi:hypothetical protein
MSLSIAVQPTNFDVFQAAYRPVEYQIFSNTTVPIVYCDIYQQKNGLVFYIKTIAKNYKDELTGNYHFDISDVCKELLQSDLNPRNGTQIIDVNLYSADIFCKFRDSFVGFDGLTLQETPFPVKPTTVGGGIQSNAFIVYNATIPSNLPNYFTNYIESNIPQNVGQIILAVTTRPQKYKLCKGDSSYMTVFNGQKIDPNIVVTIRYKDGTTQQYSYQYNFTGITSNAIYSLSNSIKCGLIALSLLLMLSIQTGQYERTVLGSTNSYHTATIAIISVSLLLLFAFIIGSLCFKKTSCLTFIGIFFANSNGVIYGSGVCCL